MDLISVIVPIYKVEKYLDQCVESIVNQTYKNLEIILVDDGSPDNCPQMCDDWAKKDERIKVVHVENGGAGKARNIGMTYATGAIISFVDSDDYIAKDFYKLLTESMDNDVGIVECEYKLVTDDSCVWDKIEQQIDSKVFLTEEALELHIKDNIFKQVIWNKIYRRELICGIKFPEGKLIDDEFWTYQAISNASKLVHIKNKLYAYRQQGDSVMHIKYSESRLQALEAKQKRMKLIKEKYPKLLSIAKVNFWNSCLYQGQMVLKNIDKNKRNEVFKKVVTYWKESGITFIDLKNQSIKYKIWFLCSNVSFLLTCKLRNSLRIGV